MARAKYRILEDRGWFYPQHKGLFFWGYFYEYVGPTTIQVRISRLSLEEALAFLDSWITRKANTKKYYPYPQESQNEHKTGSANS